MQKIRLKQLTPKQIRKARKHIQRMGKKKTIRDNIYQILWEVFLFSIFTGIIAWAVWMFLGEV